MPKGKRRSRALSWDGEVSGTEENYVNGLGSTNNRVGAVGVGTRENDNRDDNAADPVDGATLHENGASRDNRDNLQLSLGPWTQAVSEAVQSMGATQRAIKVLQDKFKRHVDELTEVDDAKYELTRLERVCSEKEDEIKRQANTIDTLRIMDSAEKARIDQTWKEIQAKTEQLKEEKEKQDKRFAAMVAEDRHKLQSEFEERAKKHKQERKERKKELEDRFARAKDDMHRTVSDLKTENQKLVATVEEQEKNIKLLSKKLEEATQECDAWRRATDSVEQEKREVDQKLEMIRDELALNSRPTEYL
jgi:chromosome segregation protein